MSLSRTLNQHQSCSKIPIFMILILSGFSIKKLIAGSFSWASGNKLKWTKLTASRKDPIVNGLWRELIQIKTSSKKWFSHRSHQQNLPGIDDSMTDVDFSALLTADLCTIDGISLEGCSSPPTDWPWPVNAFIAVFSNVTSLLSTNCKVKGKI